MLGGLDMEGVEGLGYVRANWCGGEGREVELLRRVLRGMEGSARWAEWLVPYGLMEESLDEMVVLVGRLTGLLRDGRRRDEARIRVCREALHGSLTWFLVGVSAAEAVRLREAKGLKREG